MTNYYPTVRSSNITHSLFYSIRADAGFTKPLAGPRLADSPPTVPFGDERLLGQLDWVEAGIVYGWACVRRKSHVKVKVRECKAECIRVSIFHGYLSRQ